MLKILMHIFIALILIILFVAWHAFADANKNLIETERLYNEQPRVKKKHAKLKWHGRIMAFLSLQFFQ